MKTDGNRGGQLQQQPIAGTSRLGLGANLVALSGVGLVGYGGCSRPQLLRLHPNWGSRPSTWGTPAQIRDFSPDLTTRYISHLQVAVSGFVFIALGVAVIALAWYGIKRASGGLR